MFLFSEPLINQNIFCIWLQKQEAKKKPPTQKTQNKK